ncbi:MAG TPA: lysine 5,6-aminomutase subunit alpha, partial [Myxococcaceae bacterium]|nr:lysine 5,6-aminomutase subunit alpha [Myxococcaceae bacterium]
MSGPFVQDADIARSRDVAQEIIEPIFDLIRRNTTVSVERTVLRLFGMADA